MIRLSHTKKEDRGEAPRRSTGVSGMVIPQGSQGAEAVDVGRDNGQVEADRQGRPRQGETQEGTRAGNAGSWGVPVSGSPHCEIPKSSGW